MKPTTPDKTRNVALISHGGAGKTSLAEARLFDAGAIQRLGSVDAGTATRDGDADEQKRKQSINLAIGSLEHEDVRITLVDTPGYADFQSDVIEALTAVDAAIVVVDASAGVEVGTDEVWRLADARKLPRFVFINKMDRENANYDAVLDQLKAAFGPKIAPVYLPIGTAEGFRGYIDVIEQHATVYEGGKPNEVPIPDELEGIEHSRRDALVEAAAEASDELMEKYFVGRLTYFRVFSGTLSAQAHLYNASRKEEERIGNILSLLGKDQENLSQAGPGDIVAVAKLSGTQTGDTLVVDRAHALDLPRFTFPNPTLQVSIEPESKADLDKLGQALSRMLEEEPCVRVHREDGTGETVLTAMGDAHVDVIVERLRRKFGASVKTGTPLVPYRETIRRPAKIDNRFKRQTGGHGQFGHVVIEFEPTDSGTGFAFGDRIVGGAVPKQYIPAVEKGLREALGEGVLAGYPIVDMKATLIDGSYHTVDSSEMAFKIAASQALKRAFPDADPILLEPVLEVEVIVPDEYMGDVMGQITAKRGHVLGMESNNGMQSLKAQVPQAEMFHYATELRSITQGRGRFSSRLDHYAEVPHTIADKVIAVHQAKVAAGD